MRGAFAPARSISARDEGEQAVVGDVLVVERRQQQHAGAAEVAGVARQRRRRRRARRRRCRAAAGSAGMPASTQASMTRRRSSSVSELASLVVPRMARPAAPSASSARQCCDRRGGVDRAVGRETALRPAAKGRQELAACRRPVSAVDQDRMRFHQQICRRGIGQTWRPTARSPSMQPTATRRRTRRRWRAPMRQRTVHARRGS